MAIPKSNWYQRNRARVLASRLEQYLAERGPRAHATCVVCAAPMPATARWDTKYCSKLCRSRSRGAKNKAAYWQTYYARHGKRLRAANNLRRRLERAPRRPKPRSCRQCGLTFTPKMDKGTFCSTRCCDRAMSVRNRLKENARRRRVSAARRKRRMPPRKCLACGVVFNPSRIKGRWCSKRCLMRDWAKHHPDIARSHRLVRRARLRRVPYERISPQVVFERDGWTCQWCRQPTPASLIRTTSLSRPTIDHVVPLSKGGTHLYSNVQCLCFSCNSRKGARLLAHEEKGE